MGDDDEHHEHVGKDLEGARQRREVPSSLKKIVIFFVL
jgi:hypothetical protein